MAAEETKVQPVRLNVLQYRKVIPFKVIPSDYNGSPKVTLIFSLPNEGLLSELYGNRKRFW